MSADPTPSGPFRDRVALIEGGVAFALLAVLVVLCLLILAPFVTSGLLAGILVHASWPLRRRLVPRLGRGWTALALTLAALVVIVLPIAALAPGLADNVTTAVQAMRRVLETMPDQPPGWTQGVPFLSEQFVLLWQAVKLGGETLRGMIEPYATDAARIALSVAVGVGQGVFELLFALLIAFFFYRDGEVIARRLVSISRQVGGDRAHDLLAVTGGTVQGVVWGLGGTALLQGAIAYAGFLIAGVPGAALLGFLTLILSIVQVGPPFLWGGAAIWLFSEGATGWGVFMLLWGAILVSSSDNIVRPWLISQSASLPLVLTLLGVLGGVLAFGFVGLFLGPTVLAVGFRLLDRWSAERADPA